jgi:hypothetical protein
VHASVRLLRGLRLVGDVGVDVPTQERENGAQGGRRGSARPSEGRDAEVSPKEHESWLSCPDSWVIWP